MLPDTSVAAFSIALLAAHALINIRNITTRRVHIGQPRRSSIRPVQSPYFHLAGFGTLIFGAESLLFPTIALTGFLSFLNSFPFRIGFQHDSIVQIIGLTLLTSGYVLFWLSIIARGQYAVSWDMPDGHRLVTWGPYRYVRHPSYLAYSLMFLGFVLAWLNLLAVPSLISIPGYYLMTGIEEKILIERFGDEYRTYQEKTGRLFPRLRKPRQ